MKDFPLKAKFYIYTTILIGLVLLIYSLPNLDPANFWMLLILCLLGSLSLIFKVVGATEGTHYNVAFLIYSFAFFHLGYPEALVVILVSNIAEWIRHKHPWYIANFNIGQYAVSLAGMSLVYNLLISGFIDAGWFQILAALGGMMTFTLINHLFVGIVLWFVRQESLAKSGVMKPFPLVLDFTFWVIGASAALIWNFEPMAVVLILIPLYLLYSTLKVPALERKSEVDPKTGLFNAKYFVKSLEAELSRANRFDRPMTVVMADLDLLRNINNTYGHLAGDEVLIGVANIFKENVREYDIVSRFGGEEYAILMPETRAAEAFPRIEAIREKIAAFEFTIPTSVTPITASMSFGIAERDHLDQPINEIIHNADMALYHAKSEGRNCTYIYSEEGFNGLFNNVESSMKGEILSVEDRIHGVNETFTPSKLRKDTPKAVSASGTQSQHKETAHAEDKEQTVSSPYPTTKARQAWYGITYIVLFTTLTIAILYHAIRHIGLPSSSQAWIGIIGFGALVFMAELFSVDIYIRRTSISTSAAPLIGGILLFGPVGALVFSFLMGLGTMIKHRSPVKRLIFNTANQAFVGILFISAMNHAGFSFTTLNVIGQFAVTILLAMFVYLLTTFSIALGIDLERGIPLRKTWSENFSWLAPFYLAMGVIAYALNLSYQLIGLVGLIVIIIPLIVLRYSQSLFIKRTIDSVTHLRKTNQKLEVSSAEIIKLNNELLQVLSYVIDMRDPFILGHSQQVVFYAVKIAEKLGLSKENIEIIRKGALIHDIGKLGIPESILGKKSRLTLKEYQIVKEHVKIGAEIIGQSEALRDTIPMIYHHHEHFDGSGYPDGLQGDDIPLEARILALADSVEAMASDRPYRTGRSLEEIIAEVKYNRGSHFDPQIVDIFLEIVGDMNEPFVINSADYVTINRTL
jgi:diguanylate cyclase (GGDEF)-like protein/putative nucleotidyltransferase with HDIG domain